MPRQARIIVSGLPHNIVQRGNDREAVLGEGRDYDHYLDNLSEWKDCCGLQVYSYCLMTNLVHLIIGANDCPSDIDGLMKRLAVGKRNFFCR